MLHSPITVYRSAYIENLKTLDDHELLELFYTCLRWVNYFQDQDTHYIYRKIYQDVLNEVKRRRLSYSWTSVDVKKYRILAQKMYYGSLSFKELEWKLGCIIMYSLPPCRTMVKNKMYLVRETIQVIIECIHEHGRCSELEFNQAILDALDVPFFSYETLEIAFNILRGMFLLGENALIYFLFLAKTGLMILRPIWDTFDPDHTCLYNIVKIIKVFVGVVILAVFLDFI